MFKQGCCGVKTNLAFSGVPCKLPIVLRHSRPTTGSSMDRRRPLVGVAVDAAMGFGRDVLRGVMRYANARHRWILHEELRAFGPTLEDWPQCDGAVIAVSMPPIVEELVTHWTMPFISEVVPSVTTSEGMRK